MFNDNDILKITNFCIEKFNLINAKHPDEDFYQSLPFCIIDSIFSINSNYSSTKNSVKRFGEFFNLKLIRENKTTVYPCKDDQLSISNFIKLYETHGFEKMAINVYKNRQRTSTKNGILKSEAVFNFSKVIFDHGVDFFQDLEKIIGKEIFENDIKKIKGQSSGISLKYFYMLIGEYQHIKPDRMIMRFIQSITGKNPNALECQMLITSACDILKKRYPQLSPMLLDNQIWLYQRSI